MSSGTMTVAALGRPFTLGMLYDARQDKLIPGLNLWDKTTLQEKTTETSNPSSEFQITASDSIESKSILLDVDASLKASFLGGLIEVEGSAKYLNDQKKFKNQSRVTLQYKATTNFKQLSLTALGNTDMKQTDVIKKSLATHIVTGILYGANAFFVFDSEKLDASSVQNIQGSMQAVIKKIPSFNIEGKVDIKLTDEEKDLTNKFSCKFYGDFILESNPATFEDAVKTYVELPKLLGKNREHAAPLKVWLMPLKNLVPKAAELTSEISVGLVREAEDALEGIREIKMRCNDSLEDKVSENFPEIRKTLSRFQKLCNYYISAHQKEMKHTLSSIHRGKDVKSLGKLFEDRDKSPFSQEKLSKWMDHKEREINVIRFCVDMLEGTNIKVLPHQSELDREVLASGVKDVLCFVFTSVESSDPCFDAMADYLGSPKSGSTNEDHWYFSDEVLTKMREKAKAFHDLAKPLKHSSSVRFFVTATANEKYKGATIYHYKEGKLVTEDFSKPDVPPVDTITDKSALIWYACDLSLDPNTVNNNLILSKDNKKVTYGEHQAYPDHPERFDVQQVLCREELTRRHYWEVEWSDGYNEDKGVGVAYRQIDRTGGGDKNYLGRNDKSWSLCLHSATPVFFTWYGDEKIRIIFPSTGCKRVGVYLDCPAGTLSFYNVSSNTLRHIYTFNAQFDKPVYPGCYIYSQSGSVFFCPVE